MIFKLRSCFQLTRLCSAGRAATFNISVKTFSDFAQPPSVVTPTVLNFLKMDACATDLISFIDSTPTPFHLVETSESLLLQSGFSKLDEKELWGINKKIVAGGKYFYHRNRSTIVAFTVGAQYKAGGEFKVCSLSLSLSLSLHSLLSDNRSSHRLPSAEGEARVPEVSSRLPAGWSGVLRGRTVAHLV